MNDLLLRAARGERTERPPVWLMRQAGRHLPEYRALRREYGFREAIETPEIAAEVTLQPWERYRPDGLVIFSDILPVLELVGLDYRLEEGVGPVVDEPVTDPEAVPEAFEPAAERLGFVGALLARLDDRVGSSVPLIGFAGGPFTLASYAIAGSGTREHLPARRFLARHPRAFESLLSVLADAIADHLAYQIDAGADVVQLFDTYAGVLSPEVYREVVLPLHRRILGGLEAPSIVFVRGMGGRLDLLADSGADVVSLDWTVGMAEARRALGDHPVQGNLDPAALFGTVESVRERTLGIIEAAGPAGHVLNLGHGVHRETPVEAVRAFVETAKSIER